MQPSKTKPLGFWGRCRRWVRWFRIALLLAGLAVVGSLIYMHSIGVPTFFQKWLRSELHDHGLDVEFSRLRLRWYHGLVARNLQIGQAGLRDTPVLTVDEASVRLDHEALKHFKFHVEALSVRGGRCTIPIAAPGQPSESFDIQRIAAELRLLPNDQVEVDQFTAECLGARLTLSGTLTNASAIRNWSKPAPSIESARAALLWKSELRDAKMLARKFTFSQPPEIRITIQGDARYPASFQTRMSVHATGAACPWGDTDHLLFTAIAHPSSNVIDSIESELGLTLAKTATPWMNIRSGRISASLHQSLTNNLAAKSTWEISLDQPKSDWGHAQSLIANGSSRRDDSSTNRFNTSSTLNIKRMQTKWGESTDATLVSDLAHGLSPDEPFEGNVRLFARSPAVFANKAASLIVTGTVARISGSATNSHPTSWGFWRGLAPFQFNWMGEIDQFSSREVQIEKIEITGDWKPPLLHISKLFNKLYDGQLQLKGNLDVASRSLILSTSTDCDVLGLISAIDTNSSRWIQTNQLRVPKPQLTLEASAILPPWTNPPFFTKTNAAVTLVATNADSWRHDVLRSLVISSRVNANRGVAFRGVEFQSLTSQLTCSNQLVSLDNLKLTHTNGGVQLSARADLHEGRTEGTFQTSIDPNIFLPWLADTNREGFDYFQFTTPPQINGEFSRAGTNLESLSLRVRVDLTNFVFRGEQLHEFKAGIILSNSVATATNAIVRAGTGRGDVEAASYDIRNEMVYLTNAISTLDPMIIGRAIGRQTAKAIEPYVFATPPEGKVNGSLHVRGLTHDLHFDIAGKEFNWWKFNVAPITAHVDWVGDTVSISNLQAGYYRGKLQTDLFFDFQQHHPDDSADFHFNAAIEEADLHMMMSDLFSSTNHLEGTVGGTISINSANTGDWKSWQGQVRTKMRDGYLWDFPLFGIFTPVLNKLSPGLGKARATAATGSAIITNSVLRTRDLEIHTPVMRLAYEGTVDFDGNVAAGVEAGMLRDAPLIGRVVSIAFSPFSKLFEYKVSGTLMHPKLEPMHIPTKILFAPFHAFRTLKDLVTNESSEKSAERNSEKTTEKNAEPPAK